MGGQGEKLEMLVDIQAKRQRKGKQTGMILKKVEGEKKGNSLFYFYSQFFLVS